MFGQFKKKKKGVFDINEDIEYNVGLALLALNCKQLEKVGWYFFKTNTASSTSRLLLPSSTVPILYTDFLAMSKREAIKAIMHALFTDTKHKDLLQGYKRRFKEKSINWSHEINALTALYDRDSAHYHEIAELRGGRAFKEGRAVCEAGPGKEPAEQHSMDPGYCPTGYSKKLRTVGSACCTKDESLGVPVVWAMNVEREMEKALSITFGKLLKVNIARKMQLSATDNMSTTMCSDDEKWGQYWLRLTHEVKYATKGIVNAAIGALPAALKDGIADKMKTAVQKLAKKLNKVVRKVENMFMGEIIKSRILEVTTSYLLRTGVLADIKPYTTAVTGSLRSAFAVEICEKYQRMLSARGDTCKTPVAEDLITLYTSTNSFKKVTYVKKLADELFTTFLDATSDIIAQVPGLKTLAESTRENIIETGNDTLTTVILLFFNTTIKPNEHGVTDILTYIVRVFDLATSMRSNPIIASQFPAIVTWADNIELEYDPDNTDIKNRGEKFTKATHDLQTFTQHLARDVGSVTIRPKSTVVFQTTTEEATEEEKAVGGAGVAVAGGRRSSRLHSVVIKPLF